MDMPTPADDPQSQVSQLGQQIVGAAQKLSPDDLNTLFRGVSPEAIEVMEKIPDLAPFADFIESKGGQSSEDQDMPGKRPGVAIVIGVGKARDPRADVAQAAAQHGLG